MKRKIKEVLDEIIRYVIVVTKNNKYLLEGESLKILSKNPSVFPSPSQRGNHNKNKTGINNNGIN